MRIRDPGNERNGERWERWQALTLVFSIPTTVPTLRSHAFPLAPVKAWQELSDIAADFSLVVLKIGKDTSYA